MKNQENERKTKEKVKEVCLICKQIFRNIDVINVLKCNGRGSILGYKIVQFQLESYQFDKQNERFLKFSSLEPET